MSLASDQARYALAHVTVTILLFDDQYGVGTVEKAMCGDPGYDLKVVSDRLEKFIEVEEDKDDLREKQARE